MNSKLKQKFNIGLKIKEALSKERWSWWGQRAHDALGLEYIMNLDFLVCCDWGEDIKQLWGEKVISIEHLSKIRTNYSNKDLNNFMKGTIKKEVLKRLSGGSNCIMYRSIKEGEKISRKNSKVKMYSAPYGLKEYFDNKIMFRNEIDKLEMKKIPGEIISAGKADYKDISNKWGKKFVLRCPVSSSGEKVYLIKNKKEYLYTINNAAEDIFILEKYLKGYSVNINAVVGEEDVYMSPVSVQLIGINSITNGDFSFGGNDFSSASEIPIKIKTKIFKYTEKIGLWMKNKGFKGMMGIDYIIYDSDVFPVEINPRFQNSTSLLNILQIEKEEVPLVYRHICEFKNKYRKFKYNNNFYDLSGSQIILHNLENKSIKIKESMKFGVYELDKGKIKYKRRGYSSVDLKHNNEFCICGGVPQKGILVRPGAPLIKIHFKKAVLDSKNLINIKSKIELIVKNIYNKITKNDYDSKKS
ncbi:MAG: ATP-grasp domain-containing protein [Elusimicrobiota bacterium]